MVNGGLSSLKILLVDDNPDDRKLLERELSRSFRDVAIRHVRNQTEYRRALQKADFDVVITDYQLRWSDGLKILEHVKAHLPDCPVIMFTATGTESVAVEAMKAGLDDYVLKSPKHFMRITAAVEHALEQASDKRARREAENRYQRLFDHVPVGIYRADAEGIFVDANAALVEMLGYQDRESLLATPPDALYADPAQRSEWRSRIDEEGVVRELEVELRRRDSTPLWTMMSARAIRDEEGNSAFYEGVLEDVTERREREKALKESEQQLRQSQRLESVGRLAGGIAHDFNNILTVILGTSDLALAEVPPAGELRQGLEHIHDAAGRAAKLTRQLLAFSRRQVLQPVVLNLAVLVTDLEDMLRRLIGEDIELTIRSDENLRNVRADLGQIEQVVMNLVVNARDAMPLGGKLLIEARNTHLDPEYLRTREPVTPGDYVLLSVTDTGVGMDAETQSKIFDPFFTTKELGRGTGLGLSTVYGIVKQSDGFIWVYSDPGRGSTFKVYLRAIEHPTVRAPEEREEPEDVSGSEIVLLAEDDEAVRLATRRILEVRGYTVLEAASGEEALDLARRHEGPIDLLLTDVVMAGMGGPELFEHLSLLRPETRVLFLSGYAGDAIARHGILIERVELLQKPFTVRDLLRKVRQVLER